MTGEQCMPPPTKQQATQATQATGEAQKGNVLYAEVDAKRKKIIDCCIFEALFLIFKSEERK